VQGVPPPVPPVAAPALPPVAPPLPPVAPPLPPVAPPLPPVAVPDPSFDDEHAHTSKHDPNAKTHRIAGAYHALTADYLAR
jgi:hypothetical protein